MITTMIHHCWPFRGTKTIQEDERSVQFSVVRVHEHKMILGDNPAVSEGVPVTLDWEVEFSETWDVDYFETHRRREGPATVLCADEREAMAREQGASNISLLRTCKEIQQIQLSRELCNPDSRCGFWCSYFVKRSQSMDE
jgi:hypothetical protein